MKSITPILFVSESKSHADHEGVAIAAHNGPDAQTYSHTLLYS